MNEAFEAPQDGTEKDEAEEEGEPEVEVGDEIVDALLSVISMDLIEGEPDTEFLSNLPEAQ